MGWASMILSVLKNVNRFRKFFRFAINHTIREPRAKSFMAPTNSVS